MELERLKEFGIKKDDIVKKGAELFKKTQIVNNKGQIVDQEKFNEALLALMEERFKGGAKRMGKTFKGLMSTITGITATGLASIVGMSSSGDIKKGSILDVLKQKAEVLGAKLTKMQEDGTIDKIGKKVTESFQKIYGFVSSVISFIIKHQEAIKFFVTELLALYAVVKVINMVKSAISALTLVMTLANGTLAVTPIGWIIMGIMALVAVIYLLYRNWDTVVKYWSIGVNAIKGFVSSLGASITVIGTSIKNTFLNVVNAVTQAFANMWSSIQNTGIKIVNGMIESINTLTGKIGVLGINIPKIKTIGSKENKEKRNFTPKSVQDMPNPFSIPKNALGTDYFRGGITEINERGGEMAIMPSGSKIIPSDKTDKILDNNKGINVYVIVQGNVIGNEEYADYLGDHIVKRVIKDLSNV